MWQKLDQALTRGPEPLDDLPGADPAEDLADPMFVMLGGEAALYDEDEDDNILASFGVVSHLMRQALGGYVFVPNYMERIAMMGLIRAGEDPLAVSQKYLGADRRTPTEALNQGVADVIAAYHAQMPPEAVQALVERGLALGQVTVRKAFYALAADLYGPGVWERARQDNAASIRQWAAKRAAGGR